MKSTTYAMAMVVGVTLWMCGCANQAQTSANTDPNRSTYTQEDLNKTGQQETGPALEAANPSIQSHGGGR